MELFEMLLSMKQRGHVFDVGLGGIWLIRLLLRKFVPNYENVNDKKVREQYSVLSGFLGIACNLFLFLLKIAMGIIMNSIAILSDGFNNLSDIGSSVVSIIGARLSNKRPDDEHPFGHGRGEYVAALIVSFLIMLVGVELLKGSVDKIVHPQQITFYPAAVAILAASVLVKVWMYRYNSFLGKKINSTLLCATAQDSKNDVISTGAVIVSTVIGCFLPFSIDGYIGVFVSFLILRSGYGIARDTISLLLGTPPDQETVEQLSGIILSGKDIVGMHDLIVHNYGPGRVMASVHAEIPSDADLIAAHEEIDALEQKARQEMGIMLVIHMDPILVNCEKTSRLKEMVEEICSQIDSRFSIHDFRITNGENRINLIFDLVVPFDFDDKMKQETVAEVTRKIKQKDEKYWAVIQIDTLYI